MAVIDQCRTFLSKGYIISNISGKLHRHFFSVLRNRRNLSTEIPLWVYNLKNCTLRIKMLAGYVCHVYILIQSYLVNIFLEMPILFDIYCFQYWHINNLTVWEVMLERSELYLQGSAQNFVHTDEATVFSHWLQINSALGSLVIISIFRFFVGTETSDVLFEAAWDTKAIFLWSCVKTKTSNIA